jgi:predicted Mrr-cat superfamily restriction endonuclease
MSHPEADQRAFVLRIAPGGQDCVPQALNDDDLIIGWAEAKGLLNESLDWEAFRKIVHDRYHTEDSDYRRSGIATGYLWLFIREMKPGDLVVVPHGSEFYVGEVNGPARYEESKVGEDTAYRRSVNWLNSKKPIPRRVARAALQSRMKIQGTSADAADLLDEIRRVLKPPTSFEEDLHKLLVEHAIEEIRTGKMDGAGFEKFLAHLLEGLGATEVRIVPHNQDKGADIVAHFRIAGAFQLIVAVQAKHYKPKPPVGKKVVEDLLRGMEAESADFGMVITSGTISDEAYDFARKKYEEEGMKIELVDGEQLGALIMEYGLTKSILQRV